MSILASVQSSLHPLARKLVCSWFVGIVDGQIVTIQSTCNTCVRFLLFLVNQTKSHALSFKFISQAVERNLDEVLIVATTAKFVKQQVNIAMHRSIAQSSLTLPLRDLEIVGIGRGEAPKRASYPSAASYATGFLRGFR